MTLPILLIFYVSKWNNKLGVGLLCTEMIIVCKFHDPSIIGSRDTEGGSEEPPPSHRLTKKAQSE